MQAISSPGRVTGGAVYFRQNGEKIDVTALKGEALRRFRWEKVSMVFQASQSTLNPLMTVYDQFYETALYHGAIESKESFEKRLSMLFDLVKLDGKRILRVYPHQMSGGMKQRVMIAFSMLLDPKLIILDEPTTALDVIVQGHIFKILKEANRTRGISMLLLTHDIGVVAEFSDYVAVMYGGRIMEYGTTREVFRERRHPYTAGLINATPSLSSDIAAMHSIPGSPPDIRSLPAGCVFHPRCERCTEKCRTEEPEAAAFGGHTVRCHYAKEAGHGSDS